MFEDFSIGWVLYIYVLDRRSCAGEGVFETVVLISWRRFEVFCGFSVWVR